MASSSASSSTIRQQKEDAEDRALTGLLPDDTLLQVMRCLSTRDLLSSSALVCHRWHRLCNSFGVYELVPSPLSQWLKPWGNVSMRKLLQLTVIHASTIERVHLHGLKRLKSRDIAALCQNLQRLQELSIASPTCLKMGDLEFIGQLPPKLASLSLYLAVCPRNQAAHSTLPLITDIVLRAIHERCPQLKKLSLGEGSHITQVGLNGLVEACPSLTSLDLNTSDLGWPDVALVFKCCKSLCHFSLVSRQLLRPPGSSDDDESIDTGAPRFRRRNARQSTWMLSDANPLRFVVPKCLISVRLYSHPLRSVPLEMSPALGMLQASGHQLQHLHAQGLFNASWQTISVWCPNLKVLDLSFNMEEGLFLTGVEEVVICGLIRLLKKLERIALPAATDHILINLGRFCPNLREFHFQVHWPRIKSVTDIGIVAVAEGCPNLRVLSLAKCQAVTISSARALAFHCRQLKVLLLSGCVGINDDAVTALLPSLSTSLVYLDLVGCKISQVTLQGISNYGKVTSLRVVAIGKHVWSQSQSEITNIHKTYPKLQIKVLSGIVWDGLYHASVFD